MQRETESFLDERSASGGEAFQVNLKASVRVTRIFSVYFWFCGYSKHG